TRDPDEDRRIVVAGTARVVDARLLVVAPPVADPDGDRVAVGLGELGTEVQGVRSGGLGLPVAQVQLPDLRGGLLAQELGAIGGGPGLVGAACTQTGPVVALPFRAFGG